MAVKTQKKQPLTNRKPATKKGADEVSTTKLYVIPFERLEIEPEFNQRLDYGDDFDEFQEDIKQNGVVTPMGVIPHPKKKDHFLVREGHRRYRALELLKEAGHNPGKVKAMVIHDDTPEKALVRMLSSNSGKPFSRIERGKVFAKMENFNIARKEISQMTGVRYEDVCADIELQSAPHKYHARIAKGHISHVFVLGVLRKYDSDRDKIVDVIDSAVDKAEKESKKKGNEHKSKKVTLKHATKSLQKKTPVQELRSAVNYAEKNPSGYNKDRVLLFSTLFEILDNKGKESEILKLLEK